MLRRFSSRRQRLDHTFLLDRLRGARAYRRIAGFFRSSIFELVGEAVADILCVQVVCNSDLDPADLKVARHAREVALKAQWNALDPEVESLLHRERYRRLYDLLRSGRVEIRVVPRDRCFVHGKAGVIERADGSKVCFIGSVNETRSAFAENYEIVWEDASPEGVAWVEEEFAALWQEGYPLPEAIVEEIGRIAARDEVRVDELKPSELPAAAMAEAPIYRGGEQLQPWQRAFVATFIEHRETYGKARLLLADEVGLGKTLSLAASALVAALLGDGPVLILCPANLTLQWQTELADKLGVPSMVWLSQRKAWVDDRGRLVRTRGPEDVVRCPAQIAIVSTGLIFQNTPEREALLQRTYGMVILDEAHRARRRGGLGERDAPNNLLDFMQRVAPRARHVLLGSATPIQTDPAELWDLLGVLNAGADFVLGRAPHSRWGDPAAALPVVKGESYPADAREAWEWLRNPLPPAREHPLFRTVRDGLGLAENTFFTDKGVGALGYVEREALREAMDGRFWREHNPVVRHTVLRRRRTLEEQGLLERVAVEVHPNPEAPPGTYRGVDFVGLGLITNHPFNLAYQAAEAFCARLGQRMKGAGFMRTLLLQRLCSSFASGRATAERLRRREMPDDEEPLPELQAALGRLTSEEAELLNAMIAELSRPEARDPKFGAVLHFLTAQITEGKTWLEHGCIVFSQYYDTARAVADRLAEALPGEPIALYAGAGKSGLYRGGDFAAVEREAIKAAVRRHELRLLVATDAACEGLNLQALGTLINVDLPWNPSRLEQRLGRIKRFGQRRRTVDMLNLVYHDTLDEKIYQALSKRMRDRYDLFGSLPDVIEDEWIEDVERLEAMMDRYIHLRQSARDAFEIRYEREIDPDKDRWERCARVLSRRDIVEAMLKPW